MTIATLFKKTSHGHRVAVAAVLCLFGLCTVQSSLLAPAKAKQRKAEKDMRVYLVHADRLRYDQWKNPDAQILNGNVEFTHQGARLYCDSAYFYEASNSFEAFGHVKMVEGDTLKLTSEYAFYDGNEQMAMARRNVALTHRKSVLYTDSLNYDRIYSIGYFFEGGKLIDEGSTLVSDWGEYHSAEKNAIFYYNVTLDNKKMHLTTDTLHYNTGTSVAHAVGPSRIVSEKSIIDTEDGYYNTKTDQSRLYGRSVMRDQGKVIVGDSLFHDDKTGRSEAFDNVVYTDTVNKNMFLGDYCCYDENTGYAMATNNAQAIDYSQKDTFYLHADTFKLFTYNINTDSVYRVMHAYNKVRAYRIDVQAVCDSLVYNSQDSCMTMYKDPIVWNNNQQLLGEVIEVFMKDSTIDKTHVIEQALSVEQMFDSAHYNQVASREMYAYFHKGEIYETDAITNVLTIYYPIDDSDSTIIGLNYLETSLLKMFMENKRMKKIWAPRSEGTMYPLNQAPPDKRLLPTFAWFDYVRPLNKDDIFNWRGKKAGTELKAVKRREAPLQHLPEK